MSKFSFYNIIWIFTPKSSFFFWFCGPKWKLRIIRCPKLNKYGQRACSTDLTSFLLGMASPSFLMSTNTLETWTSSTLKAQGAEQRMEEGKMVEDFSTRISNRNLKLKSPLKTIVGRDHKWRKNAKNFLLRETTQRILLKLDFTQTKGKNQYWQNSFDSKRKSCILTEKIIKHFFSKELELLIVIFSDLNRLRSIF